MQSKVKVIFHKSLKMSDSKLASQVAHAVLGLGETDPLKTIIVLGYSTNKFYNELNKFKESNENYYVHVDSGLTEVLEGESTCYAYYE